MSTENHLRYTRFERARIIGARALQLAMGAPVLIEQKGPVTNPVDLAIQEFTEDVIPITVKRTVPPKLDLTKMFVRKGGK